MKTLILQLDPYDDSVSIRDKISWSKSERIILVFPKKYRFSLSFLDLTLIKRGSESQGSQVALITRDREMQALAQSLAIPVFTSVPRAQKGNWDQESKRQPFEKKNLLGYSAIVEKQASVPRQGVHQTPPAWIRIVSMLLAAAALIGLAVYLFPSATVNLYPVTTTQKLSLDIVATDKIDSPNLSGLVPANLLPLIVSGELKGTSTGSVEIPTKKATGTLTVTNQGLQTIQLPQGTVFFTRNEPAKRFVSFQNSTVVLQTGASAVVEAEAVEPGMQGNIAEGEVLDIENISNGDLSITSASYFKGGETITVPAPSEADYQKLKVKLLQDLELKAEEMLTTEKEEELINAGKPRLETILSENRHNPVGEPSDILTLSISAQYLGFMVKHSEVVILFSRILDLSIEKSTHAVDDEVQITQVADPELNPDGEMILHLTGSRLVTKDWDQDRIRVLITGKSFSAAERILNEEIEHIKPADIISSIKFWKVLPFMGSRITFNEVYRDDG